MTRTPRERELWAKMDAKTITDAELAELREFTRAGIAHLRFSTPRTENDPDT